VTSRIDITSTLLRIAVGTAFSGFVGRLLYIAAVYWQPAARADRISAITAA